MNPVNLANLLNRVQRFYSQNARRQNPYECEKAIHSLFTGIWKINEIYKMNPVNLANLLNPV